MSDKAEEEKKDTEHQLNDDEPSSDDKMDGKDASESINETKEEKKEEKKQRTVDWPLRNIEEPHENDVLYGRGGGTNHHAGNKRYRKMVEDRKLDYVNSKRLDKPLVALDIIRVWRSQDPPGRFLKIDEKTGLWNDVGDKKAREKTSQALREKAPLIRKQQEEEKMREDGIEPPNEEEEAKTGGNLVKSTRFAEGTNMEDGNNVKKAILARDHSLGREFLEEGEAVTLDNFSWQDPFQSGRSNSGTFSGSRSESEAYPDDRRGGHYAKHGRHASHSSVGSYRYPSQGSLGPPPPPPPPGAYAHMTSEDRHSRYASHGRYESWSSYGPPPPPIPGYGYPPSQSGSWSDARREHSLCQNPLNHASISQPAPYGAFDHHRSGSWGPPPPSYGPPPYHHHGSHPPPPQPHHYGGPPPIYRSPSREYAGSPSRSSSTGPRNAPPSPPYAVDPAVASMWSGRDPTEIAQSWSGGSSNDEHDRFGPSRSRSPPREKEAPHVRPDIVKRATSNQNETLETKPGLMGPSVKRAALNRDSSAAANRLKEQYIPGYKKTPFNAEQEMRQLSQSFLKSTLDSDVKPLPMSAEDRVTTVDTIAMDLMVKPVSLSDSQRSTTIEALNLDLDDDPVVKPGIFERSRTMEEVFNDLKEGLPRPISIAERNRLSTNDFYDIVNEPISDDVMADVDKGSTLEKPFNVSREPSIGEWVAGM